jgi:diphosphomevalonate decarboxylase
MIQAFAQAQPNIALIKYWGKKDAASNLPAVDSLSLTLDSLHTHMTLEFPPELDNDTLLVNGVPAPEMLSRVSDCLDRVYGRQRPMASVGSISNFPIGAGIASSASAFAALVVAADHADGKKRHKGLLARLAGAASGSAARSIYGGIVALQCADNDIEVRQLAAPGDWPLRVVVAVTAEGRKAVGSSDAMMRSSQTSPFYSQWIARQQADFDIAEEAVRERDFMKLAAVAEHNCLKMHSVMWTSKPPVVYWNDATLACMETVRKLQQDGLAVFFTIDAGPQVKAICLPEAAQAVTAALEETNGVLRTMQSGLGAGARIERLQ